MSDRARTEAGGTSSIGVDTDSANQGQHLAEACMQHGPIRWHSEAHFLQIHLNSVGRQWLLSPDFVILCIFLYTAVHLPALQLNYFLPPLFDLKTPKIKEILKQLNFRIQSGAPAFFRQNHKRRQVYFAISIPHTAHHPTSRCCTNPNVDHQSSYKATRACPMAQRLRSQQDEFSSQKSVV